MSRKRYDILLDNKKIGETELENADTHMGVVFGQILLIDIPSAYSFFKFYCLANNVELTSDFPEDKLLATANIPGLKVLDPNNIEIRGQGTNIESMDNDSFQITILGIPFPFFEEIFPHHIK